jgi:dipeptidyl aminopeptidase/acylaminoacyl peptidase
MRTLLSAVVLTLLLASSARAELVFERPAHREVFVARDGGSAPRLLAHGIHPLVSPDGRRVAFERKRRFDQVDVLVATLPGRHVQRLLHDVGGAPLVWSPDGRFLFTQGFALDSTALYVIDVSTGRRRAVPTDFGVDEAAISPDGRTLALVESFKDTALYVVRAHGGRPHALRVNAAAPAWGRGGLAYEQDDNPGPDQPFLQQTFTEIVVRRRPNARARILLRTPPTFLSPVAWSSDGRELLVAAAYPPGLSPTPRPVQAVMVDRRTKHATTIAPLLTAVDGLSRDGRTVLAEQAGDVVAVSADGTIRRLAAAATSPSWTR